MIWEKDLKNFLGGNFHQDIESIEDALYESANENKGYITKIVNYIDEFLASDISDEEKNKFITYNTDIYFHAIGKEPVEWLGEVNDFLKSTI